jgi:hypothetical protein
VVVDLCGLPAGVRGHVGGICKAAACICSIACGVFCGFCKLPSSVSRLHGCASCAAFPCGVVCSLHYAYRLLPNILLLLYMAAIPLPSTDAIWPQMAVGL